MEPELPPLRQGPEQAPISYGQNFERAPLPAAPEKGVERGAERKEQASEQAARAAEATPVLPPPIAPVASPVVDDTASAPVIDDTPVLANDDDLIEKEWVDRAKKIIVETKDDPYRREQEVAKLQADYLKKRYGKELGAAE